VSIQDLFVAQIVDLLVLIVVGKEFGLCEFCSKKLYKNYTSMTKIARIHYIDIINKQYANSNSKVLVHKFARPSIKKVLLGILTLKYLFLGLVWFYKLCISPFLPHSCLFVPSCSLYMIDAIKIHGPVFGVCLGLDRLCRCNPFSKGGFDPVPNNTKGDMKWLY